MLFQNSSFSTAGLVFTVTFSVYRLVINSTNTRAFKVTRGCMENLSSNTMNKNFAYNLLFQGSVEQDYVSTNVKNLRFRGV